MELQILAIVMIVMVLASEGSFPIAKDKCMDRCGNVSIPFPFGTTKDCYHHESFRVTCNETYNPPQAFMQDSQIEITQISLQGQLRLLQFISRDCYAPNSTRVYNGPSINLPPFLTFNNTANKFTVIGCDSYGSVYGNLVSGRNYETGCTATCNARDDLINGSCSGLGCCQTSFPKHVWKVKLAMQSFYNYTNLSDFNCGYGFVVEEAAFNFTVASLSTLKDVEKLPMVADWAIGYETCEEAKMNTSAYACKSANSDCYNPDNGSGYRCSCLQGYQGNPYLVDACQDIDECADPLLNNCEIDKCKNNEGDFECFCPKGYHGDGEKDGKRCIRGESSLFKLVAGILLGVIVLLLSSCWLHITLQRKRSLKKREEYFHQNGGLLLQEKLTGRQRSSDSARIFSESELQKATNNFDSNMIVGQGGYGIVYKGILQDNKLIAIKKSREVAQNETEQFVNEVLVLSQINHRNVVKLLGCCLEKQAPLLVYEFISNGTLYEHIHNKAKARCLSWDMRLRIAAETAGVLSYLHSSASTPIIHRDVKSANILLDYTFTAKVSDFGASRLVPVDETQLNTLVQGTFGYLDPEYLQKQLLTEKSDVYSFGVVLVELLTGRKALSNDMPEDERCLANFFLKVMKVEDSLFRVLEDNVVREGDKKVVMNVAVLAKRCLSVRGDERPTMKEVSMELERLRAGGKHSWTVTEHIEEDKESLLGKNLIKYFTNGEGNSSSVEFDSIKDHVVLLPVGGGR